MGLAGPRKRTKLSHDPNNTAWARSTTGFGHTLLLAQGWRPGETLGARGAPHAQHYTRASAAHVRAVQRADNLGLGAKLGSGVDAGECVGLDAFQGVLGRLNGRSEAALAAEQRSREDLRRSMFVERRWGTMKFVSGGVLVGTDVRREEDVAMEEAPVEVAEPEPEEKVEEASQDAADRKKKKKAKRRNKELETNDDELPREQARNQEAEASEASNSEESAEDRKLRKAEKARRKAEKAERKRQRKLKKESSKVEAGLGTTATESNDEAEEQPTEKSSGKSTPSVPSTPLTPSNGRQYARQRYIKSKKMAVMDPQALKEILMLKV